MYIYIYIYGADPGAYQQKQDVDMLTWPAGDAKMLKKQWFL